jgi:hypothetical protein
MRLMPGAGIEPFQSNGDFCILLVYSDSISTAQAIDRSVPLVLCCSEIKSCAYADRDVRMCPNVSDEAATVDRAGMAKWVRNRSYPEAKGPRYGRPGRGRPATASPNEACGSEALT